MWCSRHTRSREKKTFVSAARTGHWRCLEELRDRVESASVPRRERFYQAALFSAAEYRQEKCLKVLLSTPGIDVNAAGASGETALAVAAKSGSPVCLRLLLAAGASVNHCDHDDYTPIMNAVLCNNHGCVKALIHAGAEIDALSRPTQQTPLMMAVKNKNIAIVLLLLQAKANVNILSPNGECALSFATELDHAGVQHGKVMDCLFRHGANPDIEVVANTCLERIVEKGCESCVRKFIKAGADVNLPGKNYQRPLIFAAKLDSPQCMKALLEADADVNKPTIRSKTPLMAAARSGSEVCLRVLLEHGAHVNFVGKRQHSESPALAQAVRYGHRNCVLALMKAGAEVNLFDSDDKTALHTAVAVGNLDFLKILVAAGANVNVADHSKCSPLRTAVRQGHSQCAAELIKAGARVNREKSGHNSILMDAVKHMQLKCAELLVDNGADIDAVDSSGNTALILATIDQTFTSILLDAGADVNISNNDGDTALKIAARNGENEYAQRLIAAGATVNYNRHGTALMEAAKRGNANVLFTLLNNGAELRSALYACVSADETFHGKALACARLLLKFASEIDTRDKEKNKTALETYISNHSGAHQPTANEEMVTLLYVAGDTLAGTTADQDPQCDKLKQGPEINLFAICRGFIRSHMMSVSKVNLFHRIPKLQLPKPVTSYLLHNVELFRERRKGAGDVRGFFHLCS